MTSGGARNRSGPPANPSSLRSASREIRLTALPSEGYDGEVPNFPLMPRRIYRWETEDKRRFEVFDEEATEIVAEREAELWAQAWGYPQACAWSLEPWRWQAVAMWVRTSVICEGDGSTAADKGSIHRFADQIGLTPAGLKENGWAIAVDQLAQQVAKKVAESGAQPKRKSARDRMTVVNGDGA